MAHLAARQHGVVSATQLRRIGFTARAIEIRLASGRLHRIHRRVYAVGHRTLTVSGARLAAVLRGGTGTVLSHRPAGDEWGLRRWSGRPAITTPTSRHPIPGIELHHSSLPADERTVLDGIPITTWSRTLLDLATVLDHDPLVRALNEADARRLADHLSLPALLERHRGERGAGALRRALADVAFGRGITREDLEERFAAFVRRHRLPPPLLNAPITADGCNFVADALWPGARLIVELQSVAFHASPAAMSADAERTRRLTLAGYRVVYVTWAQLAKPASEAALAADLRTLIDPTVWQRSPTGQPRGEQAGWVGHAHDEEREPRWHSRS
jgi:hypothetical protein